MKYFLLFLFPRARRDYDGQTQNQTLPLFPIVLTFALAIFFGECCERSQIKTVMYTLLSISQ